MNIVDEPFYILLPIADPIEEPLYVSLFVTDNVKKHVIESIIELVVDPIVDLSIESVQYLFSSLLNDDIVCNDIHWRVDDKKDGFACGLDMIRLIFICKKFKLYLIK